MDFAVAAAFFPVLATALADEARDPGLSGTR